jgi:signal transduction histidine kinase
VSDAPAGKASAGSAAVPWLDRLAHDLRGPLSPLQTASYLLQRDDLDPARRLELLQMLERQSRRLARMLDELEDWARAGQDRLLGAREPCEIALLLDYALTGAGLAGTPVDDDGAIAIVDGDPQRLTQVLRTLLDFALARGGAPALRLRSGGGRVAIEASLPGPAPDAGEIAGLFEDRQSAPFDEGLGLRLLLARDIARAHGGELAARIVDGRLQLRCELPLANGAGDAPAAQG